MVLPCASCSSLYFAFICSAVGTGSVAIVFADFGEQLAIKTTKTPSATILPIFFIRCLFISAAQRYCFVIVMSKLFSGFLKLRWRCKKKRAEFVGNLHFCSMQVSIVVAASENNVIGVNNKLPRHSPDDLKFFK